MICYVSILITYRIPLANHEASIVTYYGFYSSSNFECKPTLNTYKPELSDSGSQSFILWSQMIIGLTPEQGNGRYFPEEDVRVHCNRRPLKTLCNQLTSNLCPSLTYKCLKSEMQT